MSEKQRTMLKKIEKAVLVGLLLIAVVGGLLFGWVIREVARGDQLSLLAGYRPSTPTRLYDRHGQVFAELFRHRQEIVAIDDVPPHVIQAYLAVEDDNFYNHFGLDFYGIARAALTNIMAGRIVQGGSTLTQQVAKQIYLDAEGIRARTFRQKIRETILALQIEEELSKNEILEVFFNVIYQGHGCQGIACASRLYFEKNVQDLTIAEAALLARLPKAPVSYSPYRNPTVAKQQHRIVLNLMARRGYIPEEQIDTIHDEFWDDYWSYVIVRSPSQNIWADRLNEAPFFTDYVRQILEANISDELIYEGGLRVYTTLDLDQQRIAEEELKSQLEKSNRVGRFYARTGGRGGVDTSLFNIFRTVSSILPVGSPSISMLDDRAILRNTIESEMLDSGEILSLMNPAYNEAAVFEEFRKDTVMHEQNLEVQGALLTVEHRTGYITAMIGGSEFSPQNQFNRALQARRQPGSAFKIFVYGAAIEQRALNSMSGLNDAPFTTISVGGETWTPKNYDPGFRGLVPASTAFALSLNTCAVQTYFRTGAEPIINFAMRTMKITNRNRFHPDPALSLGSSEITPMEMLTATSIIANEGKDVVPFGIRHVIDQSGNVIYNQEERIRNNHAATSASGENQVIDPGVAFILRRMMRHTADRGTMVSGLRREGGFRGEFAGKTGTTSSWSDAWVTGFNPDYSTVVWLGFDRSSITLGPGQAGGTVAVPVLGSFYNRYYRETHRNIPRFAESYGGIPDSVVPTRCNGYAMRPLRIDGRTLAAPHDEICGIDEESRMHDQSDLIMQELGISPEEL